MGKVIKSKHFDTSKLFRIRMEKNLTLENIADAIGTTRNIIWMLESGKIGNPSFGLIVKIANALEVNVDYFIM